MYIVSYRASETDKPVILACFTANANTLYFYFHQRYMYVVFYLQCQKQSKQLTNCTVKNRNKETRVVPIVFKVVLCHVHHAILFAVSYHLFCMNQVPGGNYLYAKPIKQILYVDTFIL